ncbi:Fmp45 [Kluyveromyces lactis]|nr:Fmp45 [Kluyveromyces lactis]
MKFKGFVSSLSLLFLLGSGLLTFFVILSGARTTGVLDKFYWFEADTSGLPGAPDTTRWFNYHWCAYENGEIGSCSDKQADLPFSPRDNFGNSPDLPASFRDNRNTYYYLSRVGWAMLLIGLFFVVLTLIPMLLSFFKVGVGAVLSTVSIWLALFFITLAACLYTACYVKGRNTFRDAGRSASMNTKMFAFLWTSVFLLLLSSFWSIILSVTIGVQKVKGANTYQPYEGTSSHDDSYNVDKHTYESGVNDNNRQNIKWWKLRYKKKDAVAV